MPPTHVEWTVDMLDAMPDDGQRYEVIDGELFVTPAPAERHQLVALRLALLLDLYLGQRGVGRVLMAPADVRRGDRTNNRVQPDVLVVRLTEGKRPPYPYELHDLLLAVEVSSPTNPLLDYQVKRDIYLRERVGEYWIVNPDARNVSRWREHADRGDLLSDSIEWHPAGMPAPFVLSLQKFFTDAID
ncbi:MAG: Uma2 family endonuclease [Gemmatimonadaceae bacterium]